MKLITSDFDEIAKWYDKFPNQLYFRAVYRRALAYICGHLKTGEKLLDIGCGTGNWLVMLRERLELDLYGLDKSCGMIEAARRKNQGINFAVGIAEELPYADEEFDFVSIIESLHHFDSQEKSLTEASRVLKKGGHLLLVDPILEGISRLIWMGTKILPFERKSRYFSLEELTSLVEKNGFFVVKYRCHLGNVWILVQKN